MNVWAKSQTRLSPMMALARKLGRIFAGGSLYTVCEAIGQVAQARQAPQVVIFGQLR